MNLWRDLLSRIVKLSPVITCCALCFGSPTVLPAQTASIPLKSLPAGLTCNTTTGVLSGTPQATGTYPLQLAAMNADGVTTKLITLTVKAK